MVTLLECILNLFLTVLERITDSISMDFKSIRLGVLSILYHYFNLYYSLTVSEVHYYYHVITIELIKEIIIIIIIIIKVIIIIIIIIIKVIIIIIIIKVFIIIIIIKVFIIIIIKVFIIIIIIIVIIKVILIVIVIKPILVIKCQSLFLQSPISSISEYCLSINQHQWILLNALDYA